MDEPKNPAARLLEIMTNWTTTPANTTVIDRRGGKSEWWPNHLEAIEMVEQVTAYVHANQMVRFEPSIIRFRHAIFAVDTAMSSAPTTGRGHGIVDGDLSGLEMLSIHWQQPANIDAIRLIHDCIQEVKELLHQAKDELDPGLRTYLFELIKSADSALDEFRQTDAANVRTLSHQLVGGLVQFLAESDEEQRPKVALIISKITTGVMSLFVKPGVTTSVTELAKEATQRAIESGFGAG